MACSANESVGHPAWPPAKPAPVAPPSQGAEEAWRAFRAKWEDREIHYDSGDKQIFDEGYAAAKAEQAATSEPLSPTTEELEATVRKGILPGDGADLAARRALSELARRCPK